MDPETGVITTIGSCPDFSSVAFDYTSGTMYGATYSGSLYTVDVTTGATTLVGSVASGLIAMACDNDGELYGVNITTDYFGHINKTTGAWTAIASLRNNFV